MAPSLRGISDSPLGIAGLAQLAQGSSAVELRPAAPPVTGIPDGAAAGAPAAFAFTRGRSTAEGPVQTAPRIDSALL